MADDRSDNKIEAEFTLHEILREFGGSPPDAPGPERDAPEEEPFDNVVPFPGPQEDGETGRLGEILALIRQKTDDYAARMFEEEGAEHSTETRRIEQLIPGTDEERPTPRPRPVRERPARPAPPPPPDLPPAALYARYGKGQGGLRLRVFCCGLLAVALLYLALRDAAPFPLPALLAQDPRLLVLVCAGLLALSMLLAWEVSAAGLTGLIGLRPCGQTLVLFSCLFVLVDCALLAQSAAPGERLPFCAASGAALFCYLLSHQLRQRALRQSCRSAGAAAEPYLVTLDEARWNGEAAYTKWSGPPHGFGSQIQADDGAQQLFGPAAALLLPVCLCFSLVASVGRDEPALFFWCASALFSAAASFSGALCFSLPFHSLATRLSKNGAALAGWQGARACGRKNGILLTDFDLFPPGSVSLNGIKVFGEFQVDKVVAVAATLLRDAGSGLDPIFHSLLRTQGATYRHAADLRCHEGGGLSAEIRGEQILVGSASFMLLMEVSLPVGLNIKNAVFCAIDGELAGVFALNYTLHSTISPALTALIRNRVGPVLATRDFNLIPAMLRQKFKLPAGEMDFPSVERRWALSSSDQPHNPTLTAVLCREGLGPFSEAVVGARRLRRAVRLSAGLAAVGSSVGVLLTFYLTFVRAYASLTPGSLTAYLLLWTVPTLLISGWVTRY